MRFDLKVPFAEKDAAKKLGARWDAANKLWYVEGKADMAAFAKWNPQPRQAGAVSAGPVTPAARRAPSKSVDAIEGITIVGSRYVEQPRVCDCLPWDVCDKCKGLALSR